MAITKKSSPAVKKKTAQKKTPRKQKRWTRPFRAVGAYFAGAWRELRQVRWPNRRATWGLTLAVILFSLFFALVIVGLDYVFNYLFKEVLL